MPYKQKRDNWASRSHVMYPEDIGLAIPLDMTVDDVPDKFLELYYRFYVNGYINNFGTSCVLQSALLRRIMKLHGLPATLKQVILYWKNDRKGQHMIVGHPHDISTIASAKETEIDTHMVVMSDGWILDFAASPLHYSYGYTAPRGIIMPWTDETSKKYIDLGIAGGASYIENKIPHPDLKYIRLSQKQDEIKFTKEYFERYAF